MIDKETLLLDVLKDRLNEVGMQFYTEKNDAAIALLVPDLNDIIFFKGDKIPSNLAFVPVGKYAFLCRDADEGLKTFDMIKYPDISDPKFDPKEWARMTVEKLRMHL